jgi:AbrB family looped-hinge helix DNA binding protein
MAVTAKITSRGRLTLPKEVRAVLDVHAGSIVIFEKVNDKIIIKQAKTLRNYKGVLKTHGKAVDVDDMREKSKISTL